MKKNGRLGKQWKDTAKSRKDLIIEVLGYVDSQIGSRLIVWNGDDAVYAFLTPGTYQDDTFYNGHRQHTEISEPGVYRIDARYYRYCGCVALYTDTGIKKLRFTKAIMPHIITVVQQAIQEEIELTESALTAESTLQAILALIKEVQ